MNKERIKTIKRQILVHHHKDRWSANDRKRLDDLKIELVKLEEVK
jgi:hypothetical protein